MSDTVESRWNDLWRRSPEAFISPSQVLAFARAEVEREVREAREEAERVETVVCESTGRKAIRGSCPVHVGDACLWDVSKMRVTWNGRVIAESDNKTLRARLADMCMEYQKLAVSLAAAESALASARDKAIEECARTCEEVWGAQDAPVNFRHRALFADAIRSLRAARPAGGTDQPGAGGSMPHWKTEQPNDPRRDVGTGETVPPPAVPPAPPPPKADGAERARDLEAAKNVAMRVALSSVSMNDAIADALAAARAQGGAEGRREALEEAAGLASNAAVGSPFPEVKCSMRTLSAKFHALSRPSAPARAEKERGA